jgi:hypothetical protein
MLLVAWRAVERVARVGSSAELTTIPSGEGQATTDPVGTVAALKEGQPRAATPVMAITSQVGRAATQSVGQPPAELPVQELPREVTAATSWWVE